MQLNEILEENSIKSISKRTNISEADIDALFSGDFDKLTRVKMLGFLSIIEREYKVDLTTLKEQALPYYTEYGDEDSGVFRVPVVEVKKDRSKLFFFFILVLLGYASWYFFTQFDNKQFSELLPFTEEKISEVVMPKEAENNAELSIENVITSTQTDITPETEDSTVTDSETQTQKNNVSEDRNRSE